MQSTNTVKCSIRKNRLMLKAKIVIVLSLSNLDQ